MAFWSFFFFGVFSFSKYVYLADAIIALTLAKQYIIIMTLGMNTWLTSIKQQYRSAPWYKYLTFFKPVFDVKCVFVNGYIAFVCCVLQLTFYQRL